MRILLVMDPGILVPPKGYGGHERLVYMFAKEYQRLGHEVHLLVTKGSEINNCIVHSIGKAGFPPKKIDSLLAIPTAWLFLMQHKNKFDLIHNFGRLAYLLPVLNHKNKKIMTYGREITSKNISMVNKLPNRNIYFTGCSSNLISRIQTSGNWTTVYNAIDFNSYTLSSKVDADAPLMFLGRIEKVKGAHNAIIVAKSTGSKLILAGNISPLPEEQLYFKNEIEPFIDGVQVIYLGALNDVQKNKWLSLSKALLFPIEWNEPFGMVMVEAMACGTPVIAFNKGSVKEVVTEGKTGFIVEDLSQMSSAVKVINQLDRSVCRELAKTKFHVKVIAEQYLSL
jgi:glycosyltransferase involved in cell wall biosynthesis